VIASGAIAFACALINTAFHADFPWIESAVGWAFSIYLLAGFIGLSLLLLSKIHLESDGSEFVVSIAIASRPLIRRSMTGVSWHAVATPGGYVGTGEHGGDVGDGEGRYRVEIASIDGERTVILGPFLCWLYGISCL